MQQFGKKKRLGLDKKKHDFAKPFVFE